MLLKLTLYNQTEATAHRNFSGSRGQDNVASILNYSQRMTSHAGILSRTEPYPRIRTRAVFERLA